MTRAQGLETAVAHADQRRSCLECVLEEGRITFLKYRNGRNEALRRASLQEKRATGKATTVN